MKEKWIKTSWEQPRGAKSASQNMILSEGLPLKAPYELRVAVLLKRLDPPTIAPPRR